MKKIGILLPVLFGVWSCSDGEVLGRDPAYNGSSESLYCSEIAACPDTCRYYVEGQLKSSGDAKDGESWDSAFESIQEGINQAYCTIQQCKALKNCAVWVAGGDDYYYEEDRRMLQMRDDVSVYGGFSKTETALEDRPFLQELSYGMMSDAGGNTLSWIDHVWGDFGYIVSGADNARLDGFMIFGEDVNNGSHDPYDEGGGLLVESGAFVVANTIFRVDTGDGYNEGGAIFLEGGDLTVESCAFNRSQSFLGGAVAVESGKLTVRNSHFYGNEADQGGAIAVLGPSEVSFSNTTFTANSASGYGGAVYITARETGEGSYSVLFENTLFYLNRAADWGSAVFSSIGSKVTQDSQIKNCAFLQNTDLGEGDSVYFQEASIVNSILWGAVQDDPTNAEVRCSIVQGGSTDDGNLDSDPLIEMVQVTNSAYSGVQYTYTLDANSPCIDAADGDSAPETDYLGESRMDDEATEDTGIGSPTYADIGLIEYQG